MKIIYISLFVLISFTAFGQNDASKLLSKYGFSTETVLDVLDNSKSDFSFKVNGTNHTYSDANHTDNTVDRVFTFDNSKPAGQKFTLISVNGKDPNKKQYKSFNKEKNSIDSNSKYKLSEKDFFIKSEDESKVIIGFNFPKEELPSKMAFMAHCTGYLFIDKKANLITKLEINSNEAFNLKIFHINEMKITINLAYNADKNIYYATKEKTSTKALIFGSITSIDVEELYSDFKFE